MSIDVSKLEWLEIEELIEAHPKTFGTGTVIERSDGKTWVVK